MANITGSLGGIAGGVSQQPDILRHPGQCTEQVNMWIDPVEGLRRRPAVDFIASLIPELTTGEAFFHWFSVNKVDYVAVFTTSTVKVFNLLGEEQTTHVPVYSYINGTFNPSTLSSVQVGEYNLIANSQVACAMDTTIPADFDTVTVFLKEGMEWGLRYEIIHGSTVLASYTAPPGDVVDSSTIANINSLTIASNLKTQLDGNVGTSGYTITLLGNTIVMRRTTAATSYPAALFSVNDGRGGANISVTYREVQTLDKLPPRSHPGHWVHVSGRSATSVDDFYMRYEAATLQSEGRWVESFNPLEKTKLNASTMPHALIKVANGDFYFTPLNGSTYGGSVADTWSARMTGDAESNPEPAFIGKTIRTMTMVQNRLLLMTEDHINMSRVRSEFNMFSKSALANVDTDPIELTSPGTEIADLFAAVEHDQYLVVLGAKRQFAIPLKSALSRENAALVPTTAYAVSDCIPTVAGNGVYFAFVDGVFAGVREYSTGNVENINHADSITSHVNKYIPQELTALVADNQNSVLFAIPSSGTDLYVYQYLTQGEEKVISAWHKISLCGTRPLSLHSLRGQVYMIGQCQEGPGVSLFRFDYDTSIFLDYKVSEVVADAQIDVSTWKFSEYVAFDNLLAVVTTGPYAGLRIQIESYDALTGFVVFKEKDLFEGQTVTVGVTYLSTYTPTMPVIRDTNGKAMQIDRCTVGELLVSVQDTGPFIAVTSAPFYEDTVQNFTGRELGSTFVVGEYNVSTRTEQVSVWHDARNVDVALTTDAHTDMIIQAIEYKASYSLRGGRY